MPKHHTEHLNNIREDRASSRHGLSIPSLYKSILLTCMVGAFLGSGSVGCSNGVVAGTAPSPRPPSSTVAPVSASTTNQGNVTTVIGPSSGITAIAIDERDQLYVADNGTVRRFAAAGSWPRALAEGVPVVEGLRFAWAIAVARDGSIWVLDGQGHIFRKTTDGVLRRWSLPADFDVLNPGLAVDAAGNAYVSINRAGYREPDDGSHYILRVTPEGLMAPFVGQSDASGAFADGHGAAARFYAPGALAFDGAGNLYVADRRNLAIRRVTPDGTVTTVAGRGAPVLPPSPMPGMPSPDLAPLYEGTVPAVGLSIDPSGQLYFTASDNRVHRITSSGVQSAFAGDGKTCRGAQACQYTCPSPEPDPCDRDGIAMSARFFRPSTIVSTRTGALFVRDQETNGIGYRVRRID